MKYKNIPKASLFFIFVLTVPEIFILGVAVFLRIFPVNHTCTLTGFLILGASYYGVICIPGILLVFSILLLAYHAHKYRRDDEKNRLYFGWLPVLVNVIAIVIIALLINSSPSLSDEFYSKAKEYNDVAMLIENGVIQSENGNRYVALPEGFEHLSYCRDEVMVDYEEETIRIFFFTDYQPGWNSFGGYMYISSDEQPKSGDFGIAQWECNSLGESKWHICSRPD